jgi:hypothetical protein
LAFWYALLPSPVVFAQGGMAGGVGVGRPSASAGTSRFPIEVKLSGFLHQKPYEQETLAQLTLGITAYHETYPFEVVSLEAVHQPRLTPQKILLMIQKWQVNFDLVGPKEVLSQVAQSLPGTPLTITGFLTPRNRKFQLISVDLFRLDGRSSPVGKIPLSVEPQEKIPEGEEDKELGEEDEP